MKNYIKIISAGVLVILAGACQDYNQLVKNPNLPSSSPPYLILTGILNHLNDQNAWNGRQGSMTANQFYVSTYTYYGTNNYDQTPFTKSTDNFEYVQALQNIVQMEIEARKGASSDVNPYAAIAKFLKAYYFNLMSEKLGDVPLSQALQGPESPEPVYDSQKAVYVQILKWLDEANTNLTSIIATGNSGCVGAYCSGISGDVYLGNNLAAWQRVVNTFTLRVLISLSKKEADADLAIKAKFAAILADPVKYPFMTGLSDNLQYVYNASYNNYPLNPTSKGRDATRQNVASTYLNITTSLNDPRTFIVGTPAPAQLENQIFKITSGGSTTATAITRPIHRYKIGQTVTIKGAAQSGYNVTNATVTAIPTDSTFSYTVAAGLSDINYTITSGAFKPIADVSKPFTDFSAYIGAEAGLDMSTLGNNAQAGEYSYINALRYYVDFAGSKAEPAIIIGYSEMCFNIAEGINRGWSGGDAATWYNNGITASMNFLGITEGSSITVGDNVSNVIGTITNISIAAYLNQPSVKYQTGAVGLTQILNQKYVAFWQNSNWEAFFNQRRTGIPAFSTGAGTGNGGLIPQRWQYPVAELSANSTNYSDAVQRQFSGKDDLNGKLWIVQ